MNKKLKSQIKRSMPKNLRSGKEILNEGIELSKSIDIGQTLFLKENNVKSELEYKKRMMKKRKVTFNMQYGLSDFEKSIKGLEHIYNECVSRGHEVTRFGLCLDRSMGLPKQMRDKVARESGLFIENEEGWERIAQTVPIQPHYGDHMIGSPASVENTVSALKSGVTTIGNYSQYFTYEYPLWENKVLRTENTIRALGIMADKRNDGVLVHSNIDDGVSAYFSDTCSLIAWAILEFYIVEKLTGAKIAQTFGNLVDDPKLRMATLIALNKIHDGKLVGAMVIGNTVGATEDLDRNFASVAGYAIYDMILQMEHPTGHAIQPLPITEMIRIPTPEENAQIQVFGNQLLKEAEKIYKSGLIDFTPVYELSNQLYKQGQKYFNNMINFLKDVVDITDPLQMMLAIKNINPVYIEKIFTDTLDEESSAYKPIVPRGMYAKLEDFIEKENQRIDFKNIKNSSVITGLKAVVATTDVHEFGKMVINGVLKECGVEVFDAGSVGNPNDLVYLTFKEKADILIVSTHNGGALSYGKTLTEGMEEYAISIPVFMGGRLNEDTGDDVPVDVTADLKKIGVNTSSTPEELVRRLVLIFESDE